MRNLTRLAYENYNMFSNPILLHSKPIVTVNSPDKWTKVEETLGTIELEETFLPENVAPQVEIKIFLGNKNTNAVLFLSFSLGFNIRIGFNEM